MAAETILIAVDFSDTARKAALWAARHVAPDATVHLLHVIDSPFQPSYLQGRDTDDPILGVAEEFAERQLATLTADLGRPSVRAEVRVGKPHEQIIAVAADIGASMIVIGPHGERPRPSRFLGTTADRVARTSPVAVLVATNPPDGPPRRILAPVDDDESAAVVFRWTKTLAERFDASVTVLHVWSNAVYSHVASMSYATTRSEAAARYEIKQELKDVATHWLEQQVRTGLSRDRVNAWVGYGNPADVAIETAVSTQAQLIVVGRRGSGLVAPALLGSTVGTILHEARCPVLVVAPDR